MLWVTHTDAPAAQVVQRYKSLADTERGFRVIKSDIEMGWYPYRNCFFALLNPLHPCLSTSANPICSLHFLGPNSR